MASEYDVVVAFQDIEMELVKSMRRNMKRHIGKEFQEGINWSQWQAEMLNGLAKYKEENASMLKGYFSTINQDIEDAILEAYKTGESEMEIEILEAIRDGYKADKTGKGTNAMQGAFFKINEGNLNALIKATTEDMQKAESAILRMTNDAYRQTIFKAQMYYNTGAGSLWQAVDMATKDFLSRGINCVEYKNGSRVNIASYSEMALRTSNKRANLMGCAGKRMEYGIHTVKITAHNSACPLCIQWQGKVYYDDVYGEVTPAERRGFGDYPLLSEAVKGGMFHPNCKNGLSTYYEGINQPPKEPTKEEKEEMVRRYNLQQEQRACERNIRKYKRLEAGSLDADNVAKYAEKKQQWIGKYNNLIAENPDVLRADQARLKLYGITATDIKPAVKANNPNKIATNSIKDSYEYRRIKKGMNILPYDESDADFIKQVSADFSGMDDKLANASAKQFARLSSEYDTACNRITVGKLQVTSAPAGTEFYYNTQQAKITLNKNVVKDYDEFEKRMQKAIERGQFPKIDASKYAEYVITHEFAHTLMDFDSPLKNVMNIDTTHIRKARKEITKIYEEYKENMREMNVELKKLFNDNGLNSDDLDSVLKQMELIGEQQQKIEAFKISEYADNSIDEFMAEAFADAKLGIEPSKYSLEVLKVIDKYFKK